MKRKFTLILTIIITLTMVIPFQSFAASLDVGLEKAIKIAKSTFTIPSDYKFTSSLSTENGKKIFSLNWSSKDGQGNINVRVNENATILDYNNYSPTDFSSSKKLANISKQEAKQKADEFIKKVNPSIFSQLKCRDSNQNNVVDSSYYLSYYRIANGVSFYNDYVSMSINRQTGKVQNYNINWTDNAVFPALGKQTSIETAKSSYIKNLGLRLIYKYNYTDDKLKFYTVYVPVYDDSSYAVDAITGERIKVNSGYIGLDYGYGYDEKMKSAAGNAANENLNPDELKAVQEAAKLKTAEEVEKIARNAAFLKLTDEYKLDNSYLGTNWPVKDEYIWNLNFVKASKDADNSYGYVGVSIDAKSGLITSFYKNMPYNETDKAKYKQEECKAAVESFLKQYYPDIYKQVEFDENYSNTYNILEAVSATPRNYNYKYNRIVNGVSFPDNGININYDAVNGIISNLNISWFNVDIPELGKVISLDNAYEKLFANIGLELQYKYINQVNQDAASSKIIPVSDANKEIKLVYALKPGKPQFIDSKTGNLLDYSGNPYIESKPVVYSDISNSYAKKQIMVLADNGIYLEGTKFNPTSTITQKDFFILLAKSMGYVNSSTDDSQKEIDNLYTYLSNNSIVKTGEKAPNSSVTKEQAVKFIIRALKYEKVADIKGIFECNFKDKDSINKSLIGYVAIASGLKIINGNEGKFNPGKKLTREEAAVMIYNYLSI